MTYDIICAIMLIIAFVGGFQKGVIWIMSLMIALGIATGITIWSAPYVEDFLKASLTQLPPYLPPVVMMSEFLLLCWLLVMLVTKLWQPVARKKQSVLQNVAGGFVLSLIMLFSIAVFSGFFEQSKVISETTKTESYAYKILNPIQKKSKKLWKDLTTYDLEIRDHQAHLITPV